MEENNDDLDISTQDQEVETETVETEGDEESVEDLRSRLAKQEEIANNYKIRAEKAEKKAKEVTVAPRQTNAKKEDLSSSDIYALMSQKVPQEDISEVKDYATLKGISIKEALESNFVKTILNEKAEMRNVAEATNTGSARRTSNQMSEETLIEKASKGEFPESDKDLERLIKARKGIKD